MAVQNFLPGQILTAADTNTYLANSGLVYIGSLTMAGASSGSFTNCFSSTYDNYFVTFAMSPTPGGSIVQTTLLSGGTPATTNYYSYESGNTWAGTADVTANPSTSYWFGLRSANYIFATMNIFQPYTANYTSFSSEGIDDTQSWQARGVHKTASSFDGIRFYDASGNMTGIATCYGYRKA